MDFDELSVMRKITKPLSIANLIILILLIGWNYFLNSGELNGNTVGEVSDKYMNLFTPADYAFGIWGLIYLGLFAQAIYMVRQVYSHPTKTRYIQDAVPPLIVANLANGTWLWFWLQEQIMVSVFLMVVILLAQLSAVIRLNMEKWDAPVSFMAFVWWPIDLYFGWISVALIANVAALLVKLDVQPFFTEITWTVIMIFVATIINLFMIFGRNMREYAAVAMWAFIAIAARHWETLPEVKTAALVATAILFFATSYHAYKNRKTLPGVKIK